MGVACQATTLAATGFVCELEAEGKEEGEDAFDKRFAVTKELEVGGFVVEIDARLCAMTEKESMPKF